MSVNNVTNNTQAVSLKDSMPTKNWNNKAVQVISSGATTAALAGSIAAATLLGGPIGLIIGLAAATFMALALFLTSLASKPKNVTQESASEAKKEVSVAPLAVVKKEVEQPTQVVKETLAQRARNYVVAHPYKTALGAAAVIGAGYGLYAAYGAYTATAATFAPAAPFCALRPSPMASAAEAFAAKGACAAPMTCPVPARPLAEAAKLVKNPVRILSPREQSLAKKLMEMVNNALDSIRSTYTSFWSVSKPVQTIQLPECLASEKAAAWLNETCSM